MRSRLRRLIDLLLHPRMDFLMILEAAAFGLFWTQALRFLIGSLYSRVASASVVAALDPGLIAPATPGLVQPAILSGEITFLIYMVALPVLVSLIGRFRWLVLLSALGVAAGRALMFTGGDGFNPTLAASLTVGAGLVYVGMLIRYRMNVLPYFFILGLGLDQVYRAVGNTLDPSWAASYANTQIILSVAAVALAALTLFQQRRNKAPEMRGLMPFWGGIGLGALLFLELSFLTMPNAIAGRADVDYTAFVPFVLAATLLPVVPWIREQARSFVALFDGGTRGWVWMLVIALLMVIGTRIQNVVVGDLQLPVGGVALIVAQLTVSLMWWWLARPQAERERNFSGLWLTVAILTFGVFIVFDNFTYEYAFVRNFSREFSFLNNIIPPLLRGFRGMGLAVILLSVFLAAVPMIQTPRRIPWTRGTWPQTLGLLLVIIGISVYAADAARPRVVSGVRDVDRIRVGTYNLHSGFSEFYNYDLESVASTIQQSGANVVLLQEIEKGRITSFGVDQPLWLARRLGMDTRFFPTNEGLHGLAVLSNIEIVFDEGQLLTSTTQQTGLQRIQVRPDEGVITFYNTWLGYPLAAQGDNPVDDREAQTQLAEIFSIISSDHPTGLGRTVIGGSFNNVPDAPLLDRMRQTGFTDPFAGRPIELSATLYRTGLRARFDYLWVRPPLLVIGADVMTSAASDRRMVVVEMLISSRP